MIIKLDNGFIIPKIYILLGLSLQYLQCGHLRSLHEAGGAIEDS